MKAPEAAGFTLLEIVVALAVFGFLLLGLSHTVRFGLTAWRQDTRMSEEKTDLEAIDPRCEPSSRILPPVTTRSSRQSSVHRIQ